MLQAGSAGFACRSNRISLALICWGVASLLLPPSSAFAQAPPSPPMPFTVELGAPSPDTCGPVETIVDTSPPLSPEALGLVAILANPDLKAARAKAKVAEAQLFAAGLLPDPSITLSFDYRMSGPDPFNALLGQIIVDLAALRTRHLVVAGQRAARGQVRLDIAWQEWQTAGQARLLAARISGLEVVLPIDLASQARADTAFARTLPAAARGDLRGDELEARRLAAFDAGDRARQAERDLQAARLDLNKLLGLPPEARVPVAVSTQVGAAPQDAETLFSVARTKRLDLQAPEAGYQSQEPAVRKAVLDQFPTLQLTLSRAQDTAKNQTIGPAINFTLPLENRNRGGIAIAEATRDQLRAEYEARIFNARADIAQLVATHATEQRQRQAIAVQIAASTPFVVATENAVARGDLTITASDSARQSVADKRLALASLDQGMAEQTIALELLVGAPLDSIVP